MSSLFIDVSVFQPHSEAYFASKRAHGAKAVVVKATEGSAGGTGYINPVGKSQIINAQKAGLRTHLYHFCQFNSLIYGSQDPINEAKFFSGVAYGWGLKPDQTVMVFDAESTSLRNNAMADCLKAIGELARLGWKHFDVYGSGSWYQAGRLRRTTSEPGWLAAYGVSRPTISPIGAWQFTDNWLGSRVDASIDYAGKYTKQAKPTHLTAKTIPDYYYTYNPHKVIIKKSINQYKKLPFSKANVSGSLKAGKVVQVKQVHYKSGHTPAFELTNGKFITCNRDYVNNAYYELPLKSVEVIKRIKLYQDPAGTKVVKHSGWYHNTWKRGTPFTVKKVLWYKGVPRLLLDNGYYCTALKTYVKRTS